MKINVKGLALAAGVFWSLSAFLLTWLHIWTGYAPDWFALMKSIYPGYETTAVGSIVGLIYGFFDGFVSFFIVGWLYNKFSGND